MAVYTTSGWHLGNLPDIESAPSSLLTTFGSAGDILGKSATTVDMEYSDTHMNENTAGETLTYDVGAGPVTALMEQATTYTADIELVDGSSITVNMVVVQSPDGETFVLHSMNSALNPLETTQVEAITFTAIAVEGVQVAANYHTESIPPACLCPGTMVRTPYGDRPVEDLVVGDLIDTAQRGPQPLRWIGIQRIDFKTVPTKHMPIEFKPGSLGHNLPERMLVVSPNHRMVLEQNRQAVLGPAKAFTSLRGVRQCKMVKKCAYYALLFDRHEIIFAEGVQTESFLPGIQGLRGFSLKDISQISEVVPRAALARHTSFFPPALLLLTRRETEKALCRNRAIEIQTKPKHIRQLCRGFG